MSEWHFDMTKISVKEYLILTWLAQMNSTLMLHHFAILARKAGVDVDDVDVTRLADLLFEFVEQASQSWSGNQNDWPGVWATWNETE